MSCFAKLLLSDEERPGTEPFEGVNIERREILFLSAGALAALSLGWPRGVLARREPDADEAWDTLIRKTIPMAEELVHDPRPDEEAYLRRLGRWVSHLPSAPEAEFFPGMPVASAWSYDKFPFMVMQFKLAPGAAIPYHDHRGYNGVLKAVSGEARIRSFEIVGAQPAGDTKQTFQIRETHNRVLRPGSISSLSRTRDNIHDVRAGPDGVRLIDFFTFFQPDGRSVYLDVEQQPRDARRRLYEASWQL